METLLRSSILITALCTKEAHKYISEKENSGYGIYESIIARSSNVHYPTAVFTVRSVLCLLVFSFSLNVSNNS